MKRVKKIKFQPTKPNQLKPKHTERQRTTLLASNASCTPAKSLRPDVGLVADAIIALLSRLVENFYRSQPHTHTHTAQPSRGVITVLCTTHCAGTFISCAPAKLCIYPALPPSTSTSPSQAVLCVTVFIPKTQ